MKNRLLLSAIALSIVTPVFVAPNQTEAVSNSPFTDVSPSHSAYEIIHAMRDQNVISGYPDGTFKPSNSITRKHVAALLARALPLKPIRQSTVFTDVPNDHPYYEEIQKVQRAGIIDGSDGLFKPDLPLTRVQMAKVLDLAFNLEVKATHDFPDVPTSHWGNEHVRALYSNGITTGSNGLFLPNEPVTRAHYATFLYRALNPSNVIPEPIKPPSVPVTPINVDVLLSQNARANLDVYDGMKIFNKESFSDNPISAKMHLDGVSVVRDYGMKFYTSFEDNYNSQIALTADGFQNGTESFGDLALVFGGIGESEGYFSYDFRSDNANEIAKKWLQIGFPQIAPSLLSKIDEKVQEARREENSDNWFAGNGETLYVGDYKIRIGVDSFFEWMSMEIELVK